MSDATFAVDNAVPILSNAIFMPESVRYAGLNYAIYFTAPLNKCEFDASSNNCDNDMQLNGRTLRLRICGRAAYILAPSIKLVAVSPAAHVQFDVGIAA